VCGVQGAITVMQVDLADLASVRALAQAFQATERGPDLLVSAAGSGPGEASALLSLTGGFLGGATSEPPSCGGLFHAASCVSWHTLSLTYQIETTVPAEMNACVRARRS